MGSPMLLTARELSAHRAKCVRRTATG